MSSKKPLILSINIPFCPTRCAYCDKHTTAIDDLEVLDRYAAALRREIEYSAHDYTDYEISAMWIGGGIASHLFDEALGDLLWDMRSWFSFSPNAEITLKAHPGMISVETLNACRRGKVSRLSIELVSTNSFENEPLGRFLPPSAMNTTQIVLQNTSIALSFDLVLGLPAQTPGTLIQSLEKVASYGATHISLYMLRIAEGTPFSKWVAENAASTSLRRHLPDESERAVLTSSADLWLREHGFSPYLPGHYALEGHASQYHLLQNAGCAQLGFGANAESFIDGLYSRNTANIRDYCRFSPNPQKITQIIRPLV